MESRAEIDALKNVSRHLDGPPSSRMEDEIFSRKPVYTIALLVMMGFLLVSGAFNIYSASGGDSIFTSHMKHMCLGLMAFFMLSMVVQPKHLNASTYWLYGAICILLVTVLVIGHIGGGSRRWITFGPLNGQPSELAK
ncbi:hypothetical protein E3A20_28280, partial [Planctomyces bekefii]